MSCKTHFLLNDREICATEPAGMSLLDYLRKSAGLTGVKEGCKEGDCGACTVLIGELSQEKVHYKSVTSCLVPLAEMQGKHVVTIEGINACGLTPVQQTIFDEGGSQCGFCTPGIVLSLTCYLLESDVVDYAGMKNALSGHLCRCTGYSSLKRSGVDLVKLARSWGSLVAKNRMEMLIQRKVIPAYFRDIASRLHAFPDKTIEEAEPDVIIAGGTDIYVQKGDALADAKIAVLSQRPEWKGILRENGTIRIGALTTFEEFAGSREIAKIIPEIDQYMHLVASLQIRNRATLGGNIVNASPIGDMTILLLALNATLVLKKDDAKRLVPLRKFFKGYKKLDKENTEMVAEIILPIPDENSRINFEKLSKRKCLDIATVNSAILVKCDSQGIIEKIDLAMGGVAPVPLFLESACAHLVGKQICPETILGTFRIVQDEISPISDVRGSQEYKRLLARQFIISHFSKLYPLYVKARDFYETY